mmetsp:Transcript_15611/g.48789  ORF Transcript_15611/g.48789 Transcript_15611/m.48789 type:complete len:430 (+) Transcript_15611:410-1699(+)
MRRAKDGLLFAKQLAQLPHGGWRQAVRCADRLEPLARRVEAQARHVLHHSHCGDADLVKHLHPLDHVHKREPLRRRHQHRRAHLKVLAERQLHIAGAGRHVDDQIVELAPSRAPNQLLHDRSHLCAAQRQRPRVDEAHRHELQPVCLERHQQLPVDLQLPLRPYHGRQAGPVHVDVDEADPPPRGGEGAGEVDRRRRLAHPALAARHSHDLAHRPHARLGARLAPHLANGVRRVVRRVGTIAELRRRRRWRRGRRRRRRDVKAELHLRRPRQSLPQQLRAHLSEAPLGARLRRLSRQLDLDGDGGAVVADAHRAHQPERDDVGRTVGAGRRGARRSELRVCSLAQQLEHLGLLEERSRGDLGHQRGARARRRGACDGAGRARGGREPHGHGSRSEDKPRGAHVRVCLLTPVHRSLPCRPQSCAAVSVDE